MTYSQDTLRSEIEQLREAMSSMPTKMDTQTTTLDAISTKLDALTAALVPPNTSLYTTALGALGNPTVRSGSGKVYAFAVTGIVEIRDNTTVLWTTIGNTSMKFDAPLVYSTSLKLFSTLGSGISLQYE